MDDRGPADDPAERAEFAPTRLGGPGRRAWSPLVVAGWLVVMAAVVGLGVLGQRGAVRPGTAALASSATPARPTPRPAQRPDDPPSITYQVDRDASGVTITGLHVPRAAVWVFISVQTGATVVGWRSLSVEQADGIRLDSIPVFETHVALPPAVLAGSFVVEVNAYNDLGRKIGSVRQPIPSVSGG